MKVVDARMSPQSPEMICPSLPQTPHHVMVISTSVSSHFLEVYVILLLCIYVKGSQNCSKDDGVQE
jgi:hypothetical protein